jgi:hypothetical protein
VKSPLAMKSSLRSDEIAAAAGGFNFHSSLKILSKIPLYNIL